MLDKTKRISEIVAGADNIVIIQADNPDGDSMGSALALEEILGELGKNIHLYCSVDMPGYLRYMKGWDRVNKEIPKQFDASIIVDASTLSLLEKLESTGEINWLSTKPCVVLDHHESVERVIPFATIMINEPSKSSTGELIYEISKLNDWPLTVHAQELLMTAILGDTQGLSNQLATEQTYRVMAGMIAAGVSRPKLEEVRREYGKMPLEIFKYKADLIGRAKFSPSGKVASVIIPQSEITKYSPLYNPAPLIQNDLLQTLGVGVAIVFKLYDDGRVTAAIRSNPGYPIASKIAVQMGGGGHAYASGFKDTTGKSQQKIVESCLEFAEDVAERMKVENETI